MKDKLNKLLESDKFEDLCLNYRLANLWQADKELEKIKNFINNLSK